MENPIEMDDWGVPLFLETPNWIPTNPNKKSALGAGFFSYTGKLQKLKHLENSNLKRCHKVSGAWDFVQAMWATKQTLGYFPLYWLVNRDPYSALL